MSQQRPPAPAKFPKSSLYLIYGNAEAEVASTRYDLVCSLLTPEERDAGLTEIRSAGNAPLTLDRCLNEVIEELGTASFLADSRRVAVIYDLKELFDDRPTKAPAGAGARKGKDTAAPKVDRTAVLIDWLRDVLPTTGNVAVFVALENDEKQRTVTQDGALFRFLQKHGVVLEKKEKPVHFDFEDHVMGGNTAAAISVLREWLARVDSTGRGRVLSAVGGMLELALQARCQALAREEGVPEGQAAVTDGFPTLARVPGWKIKKVHQFAARFTMPQLQGMLHDLRRLQAVMYPTGEEDYIPDWEELMESLVLQMTLARPASAPRR